MQMMVTSVLPGVRPAAPPPPRVRWHRAPDPVAPSAPPPRGAPRWMQTAPPPPRPPSRQCRRRNPNTPPRGGGAALAAAWASVARQPAAPTRGSAVPHPQQAHCKRSRHERCFHRRKSKHKPASERQNPRPERGVHVAAAGPLQAAATRHRATALPAPMAQRDAKEPRSPRPAAAASGRRRARGPPAPPQEASSRHAAAPKPRLLRFGRGDAFRGCTCACCACLRRRSGRGGTERRRRGRW